jgi:hypothetical protein
MDDCFSDRLGDRFDKQIVESDIYAWASRIAYKLGGYEGKDHQGRSFTMQPLDNLSRNLYVDMYISYGMLHISIGYVEHNILRNNYFPVYKENLSMINGGLDEIGQNITRIIRNIFRNIRIAREFKTCSLGFPNGCDGRIQAIRSDEDACELCQNLLASHGKSGTPDMVGYAYIIGNRDFKIYKIGFSSKPNSRIGYAQNQVPFDVSLIHTIATNEKDTAEKFIHSIFSDGRLRGEWFRLTDEQVKSIKSIEYFRFDSDDSQNKLEVSYTDRLVPNLEIKIEHNGDFDIRTILP